MLKSHGPSHLSPPPPPLPKTCLSVSVMRHPSRQAPEHITARRHMRPLDRTPSTTQPCPPPDSLTSPLPSPLSLHASHIHRATSAFSPPPNPQTYQRYSQEQQPRPTSMSQPMASTDQIGIPIDLSQQGPEAPVKRAPVAKKARAKTGGASAGAGEMNDFDFKFGFNFQSPAKTIRYVERMLGCGRVMCGAARWRNERGEARRAPREQHEGRPSP